MRGKRLVFVLVACWVLTLPCLAAQYTKEDSCKVMTLLGQARGEGSVREWMLFFARELRNISYVGKTLEGNSEEKLIVNLRELDCTTYVETVLALTLCMKNEKKSFRDYCDYLRLIRYEQGVVDYPTRLHYFSQWIDDNTSLGFIEERQQPIPPFIGIQKLHIDFMSTHTSLYPMLTGRQDWIKHIEEGEKKLTGREIRYIPKGKTGDTKLLREVIRDGDIIAITTSKRGLDVSHIGIAVWHKDGLHLLNASQIRKKVVEEPMTLYQYMQQHPSQLGIRVVRVK